MYDEPEDEPEIKAEKEAHIKLVDPYNLYRKLQGPCEQQQVLIKNLDAFQWIFEVIDYDIEFYE
jgi:hypothetical protein